MLLVPPPWCFLGPDRNEKLRAMVSGDKPEEAVSGKIWELVRLGFPKEQLFSCLDMLENVSWSNVLVENGHIHASAIMLARCEHWSQPTQKT